MNLPIQTHETNQRQHTVVLEQTLMDRILAKAVADHIGLDVNAANIKFTVSIEQPSRGSINSDFNRKVARVTITEDFGPAGG